LGTLPLPSVTPCDDNAWCVCQEGQTPPSLQGVKPMGDDPMALLGLEGALKHYYYYLVAEPTPEAIGGSGHADLV
jgi:hypothetical protein